MGVFLCIDGMIRCIDVTMVTKFFTTYISIFQTFGSTCIWFCYVFKCWVILGHFMTSWIKDGGTVTSHNDVVNIEIPSVLSKDYRAKKVYQQKWMNGYVSLSDTTSDISSFDFVWVLISSIFLYYFYSLFITSEIIKRLTFKTKFTKHLKQDVLIIAELH